MMEIENYHMKKPAEAGLFVLNFKLHAFRCSCKVESGKVSLFSHDASHHLHKQSSGK